MFPSFNSDNSFDQSFLKKSPFPPDQNPSSKQNDPQFFFNFPSPFFDEHESPLNQIFVQNHQMAPGNLYSPDQTDHTNTDPRKNDAAKRRIGSSKLVGKEADPEAVAPLRRRSLGVVPRRRTGKKDRHSKICTAQGIRDRRMRLSLQVARKFFDLQDMLGYDKASKTIEWLFTKSRNAIKELTNDHPQKNNISTSDAKSESFLSDCEVVSGIDHESTVNKDVKESIVLATTAAATTPPCISPCEEDERKAQKPNTRESREKARARARCRTREKMVQRLECSGQWYRPNPAADESMQKSSNNPFEGVDQESNSYNHERISPYQAAYNPLEQQLADVGTIERFLGNSSSSSSSSWSISAAVSGYTDPNSSFVGFFGNWDLLSYSRTNSIYPPTNQVSLAGNPSSVYSATAEFP